MDADVFSRAQEAASAVAERLDGLRPSVAVVLGSGLGDIATRFLEASVVVPYRDIPHLREPSVSGHAGRILAGPVAGVDVVVFSGRVHGYEGYSPDEVTFQVRLAAALGVDTLVLTNAAGGIDPGLRPGDLMYVEDHLNLTGSNPLTGTNDERLGPRFPDMSSVYDAELRRLVKRTADDEGIAVRKGIYAGVAGPSYETPAEVRLLRVLGADAVGMSTVHEAIVARHTGLRIVCISCITNSAAGSAASPLTHTEVIEIAQRMSDSVSRLLRGFLIRLSDERGGGSPAEV